MTNIKYKLTSVEKLDNSQLESVHNRYLDSTGYINAKIGSKMVYEPCDKSVGMGLFSSVVSKIKVIGKNCFITTENSIYKFEEVL